MRNNNLVSIIIPTYNREKYIAEALQSILQQSYTHWECIIVDDGSTDASKTIVDNFVKTDSRFQYVKRPNTYPKGVNACRNYGITLSKGDYIAFCDDDDFWLPKKLEQQIAVFNTHPDVGLVTGNVEFVNTYSVRTGRVINQQKGNTGYVFEAYLFKNRTSAITPVFKKEVLSKTGLLNMTLFLSEDWEFWRRVSYYYKFYAIDDVLACVRKHQTNNSLKVNETALGQYKTYKQLTDLLLQWGKNKFNTKEFNLIQRVEQERYVQLLQNHCPGVINKLKLIANVFKLNPAHAITLVSAFMKIIFKNT